MDWAFFVEKHTKVVDWKWLLSVIEGYNMMDFFNCINAICVENLGIPSSIFPCVQFNPNIKEMILSDIFLPTHHGVMSKNILSRVYYKIRRWRSNAWKHELCYNIVMLYGKRKEGTVSVYGEAFQDGRKQ